MWTVVHESLLETNATAEPLVVANCPWIAVDFVHVFSWNAADNALLDNFGIFPYSGLYQVQVLHSNLYEEGKVCLSILGTWAGDKTETWSAAR